MTLIMIINYNKETVCKALFWNAACTLYPRCGYGRVRLSSSITVNSDSFNV